MFNEEATHWPPYVENKRGIPICITTYILPQSAARSAVYTDDFQFDCQQSGSEV